MNIGIFGTGMVGTGIGTKLVQLGHRVMIGSRTAHNEKAVAWVDSQGGKATEGTFADAAGFGEVLFNCTAGIGSIEAITMGGSENTSGKILIDVSNPLDFSRGMPPVMAICNTDSLGEQIQRAFPEMKVVKTLNTMNSNLMVNPKLVRGDHNVFFSGNYPDAKEVAMKLIGEFGWSKKNMIDLGDITTARGTEMMLPMWLRLWSVYQSPNFNFHIVVKK